MRVTSNARPAGVSASKTIWCSRVRREVGGGGASDGRGGGWWVPGARFVSMAELHRAAAGAECPRLLRGLAPSAPNATGASEGDVAEPLLAEHAAVLQQQE